MRDIRIERLAPVMTPLVNRFYQACGARGRANRAEWIWVARAGDQMIGACRFAPGNQLLLGLHVAESWRGLGIAGQLINQVVSTAQGPVYTFPYRHLAGLYQRFGFVMVAQGDVPETIRGPFLAYRRQGRDILLMATRQA